MIVGVNLQGEEPSRVIEELVDQLVVAGKIQQSHRGEIISSVKKRELAMSTGIGLGVALPHAFTDLVSEVVYVIGRSTKGISFHGVDNEPVHRVLLFLVPASQFQRHIHVLADMAKLLHKVDP